uniref:Uncharacterized protein n=1 Tax=Anopheles funestus TaxID=62324 RepID=A0A4Y0BFZ1_ANOFN
MRTSPVSSSVYRRVTKHADKAKSCSLYTILSRLFHLERPRSLSARKQICCAVVSSFYTQVVYVYLDQFSFTGFVRCLYQNVLLGLTGWTSNTPCPQSDRTDGNRIYAKSMKLISNPFKVPLKPPVACLTYGKRSLLKRYLILK